MSTHLFYAMSLYVLMHICVWFSVNLQFVNEAWKEKSFFITMLLALPISAIGYWAAKFGYHALNDSAWSVRFIGFGMSYLVFPVITWALLGESMLTAKTLSCIFLSIVIVCIQVFWN